MANSKINIPLPVTSICLVCLFLFPFFTFAQQINNNPAARLEAYSNQNLQEKIFVHVGKPLYVPGEIIWFKIYITDARLHMPADLSKVAYVELLDAKNTPALQAKIKLHEGTGNGSFQLPASLASGYYRFRAYTSWMKNNDAGYFFEKQLTIINTHKNLPHISSENSQYNVQLFPEGGNLLANVNNTVAFKITDQYGKGVDGNGVLLNQHKDTIIHFSCVHLGMGRFEFTPQAGNMYKVNINAGSRNIEVPLPEVYQAGYNLHLAEAGPSQLSVTVSAAGIENGEPVLLLSQTRGKMNMTEAKKLTDGKAIFSIDKTSLLPGITTFSVFNSNGQPVAERLYFKKPQPSAINVNTSQTAYSLRSKVSIECTEANQSFSANETANLSVSVYRIDSLQKKDQPDIASYFWLSSDIKGAIEDPLYYFKQNTDEAADNLMLTQGWRRFNWKDVLENNKPVVTFLPEYEGPVITGKIVNRGTGKPVSNIMAYLSSPAKAFQFSANASNEQGLVYFNLRDLSGTENVVIQTDPKHHTDCRLDILSPFSESYPYSPLPPLRIPSLLLQQLYVHGINSQVEFIYSNDSLNKFYLPSDTTLFFGKVDKSYNLDDYTRFTTMEEVLREYIKEVTPRKQGNKFHLSILKEADVFYDADPLVLIDGVPFFDMDSVIAADPLKIQKLDVVKREYISGSLKSSGLLSFSTYKGDLDGIRLDPNAIVVDYEGLQLQREFYAPVYETDLQKKNRVPDFRNQLYWNPDVNITGANPQSFTFYTSDLPGTYLIEVQGVSSQGKILNGAISVEVKK